jgi:hypothetical protein
MRRAPRPGDREIAIGDAQHAHQMHRAEGQVDGEDRHPLLGEAARDLPDPGVVGAQAAADQHGGRVEPQRIRALEGGAALQRREDRHAQRRQPRGDAPLLAGAHGRGRPRQDRAAGSHEHEIGAEHLVGRHRPVRIERVHRHTRRAIGGGHGVVLRPGAREIERRQHLRGARVGRCAELVAGAVQQHRAQPRPLAADRIARPERADLVAMRGCARRPAGAAIGRGVEGRQGSHHNPPCNADVSRA